jgi:hypothetical protein
VVLGVAPQQLLEQLDRLRVTARVQKQLAWNVKFDIFSDEQDVEEAELAQQLRVEKVSFKKFDIRRHIMAARPT